MGIKQFLKNVRVEEDLKQKENNKNATEVDSQEDTEDNNEVYSTQEMIFDARARRTTKTNTFHCENCEFKSSSKTLLNKHIESIHNEEKPVNSSNRKEMRKRFICDKCNYKTTNEKTLK